MHEGNKPEDFEQFWQMWQNRDITIDSFSPDTLRNSSSSIQLTISWLTAFASLDKDLIQMVWDSITTTPHEMRHVVYTLSTLSLVHMRREADERNMTIYDILHELACANELGGYADPT